MIHKMTEAVSTPLFFFVPRFYTSADMSARKAGKKKRCNPVKDCIVTHSKSSSVSQALSIKPNER